MLPAWTKLWAAGFANKLREIGDGDGDFFILSRSAWAGTASSGTALWSGDQGSTFRELATAVRAGQQAGLSGIPLWTTDIGGYAGGDPSKPAFQELIVRWFQFGAFCPLFRLHGHRGGKDVPPPNQASQQVTSKLGLCLDLATRSMVYNFVRVSQIGYTYRGNAYALLPRALWTHPVRPH